MDLEELIKQKNTLYHELNMELGKPTDLPIDQKSLNEHKEKISDLCYLLASLESKIAEILFIKGELENSVINLISQASYLADVHEYEAARCALIKAKARTKKEAVIKHINEELIKLKQQRKTARQLRNTEYPACASICAAMKYLGIGECEAICPHKFTLKENNR